MEFICLLLIFIYVLSMNVVHTTLVRITSEWTPGARRKSGVALFIMFLCFLSACGIVIAT